MATVGLVPGFVIGLREGIEAALIIGILIGYLVKTERKPLVRFVLIGVTAAVIASVVVAAALFAMSVSFEGFVEEVFEGVMAVIAVAVLTFVILWMMRVAKDVRKNFELRLDTLAGKGQILGLVGLAFVAVFREGLEAVLFMMGVASSTTATDAVVGVAIGLMLATVIALLLPRLSTRVSFKRFFQVTSIFLIIIAAGLFAQGIHELQEAFAIQAGSTEIYDLRGVFPHRPENPLGYLLHGIIGYSDSPSQLEVVAYFSYLGLVLFLWWYVIIRKPEEVEDVPDSLTPEKQPPVTSTENVPEPPTSTMMDTKVQETR